MAIDKLKIDEHKKFPAHYLPLFLSYLLSLVNIALAFFFYQKMQPQIPIFFSLFDATAQLANKEWIFLLPIISFFFSITHHIIIFTNRKYDEFLWFLLALITLFYSVFLLAINIRIIWLIS